MPRRTSQYGPLVDWGVDRIRNFSDAAGRAAERIRTGGADTAAQGSTAEFDPLIKSQQDLARLRQDEAREMDRLVRSLQGMPAQLEGERGVAQDEMRRAAALKLATIGGRDDVIGAGSAAKAVGQEAANIGTRFGDQIRAAAERAAKAKIERAQQRIQAAPKPGVDVERVRASLQSIVDRNAPDLTSKVTFGLAGQGARPKALENEILALERTTGDPLALQLIAQIKANIQGGRDPFADVG